MPMILFWYSMYILDVIATTTWQCLARLPYDTQQHFLRDDRAEVVNGVSLSRDQSRDGGQKDSRREDKAR